MRGLLLAVLAMCVACGKQPTQQTIYRLDANHTLGEAVERGNLTVWPVFADTPSEIGEFLTLKEAQERGLAHVSEKKSAEVASLMIENTGTLPILVCAGSLVKGGRQDRQIGQDFIIQAGAKVPVEAFCVEQSRWSGTDGFNAINMIATAGVRKAAQYDKDQGKVWNKIAEGRESVLGMRGLPTRVTIMMSEEIEVDMPVVGNVDLTAPAARGAIYFSSTSHVDVATATTETTQSIRSAVLAHFAKLKQAPVGFAYAIGGKPVSVRTFAHPRLMRDRFGAFLDAMCLESTLSKSKKGGGDPADIVMLVSAISTQAEVFVDTEAGNRNGYRKGKAGFNGSCYTRRAGRLVAVTRDWSTR